MRKEHKSGWATAVHRGGGRGHGLAGLEEPSSPNPSFKTWANLQLHMNLQDLKTEFYKNGKKPKCGEGKGTLAEPGLEPRGDGQISSLEGQ